MNGKRVSSLLILLFIFCVPVWVFLSGYEQIEDILYRGPGNLEDGTLVETVETFVKDNLPYQRMFNQLSIDLRLLSGQVEQDGIYIAGDMLLENISGPNDTLVWMNRQGILDFTGEFNKPTYFMLIPTSVAIKQQEVPSIYAPLYNQKRFIEETYGEFSGEVSVVDAYSVLYANKEQYLYYKTESNLTSLGGFRLYSTLGRRLGLTLRTANMFDQEHVTSDFYGNLYERFPYKNASPDVITLYRYTRNRREYQVTHLNGDERKVYSTLYPYHTVDLGSEMNIFFGGKSEVIDIKVSSNYARELLIFADETYQSYLPFLLPDYGRVTVVNLATVTPERLFELEIDSYDQILIACSVDTYMHSAQVGNLSLLAAIRRGELVS